MNVFILNYFYPLSFFPKGEMKNQLLPLWGKVGKGVIFFDIIMLTKIILLLKNQIIGLWIKTDCCQMLNFVGIKSLSDTNNI